MKSEPWYVYFLECDTGRIYTGISPDVPGRIRTHQRGKGAFFTRLNPPRRLLAVKPCSNKIEALSLERRVKPLAHAQKRWLAAQWSAEYPFAQLGQELPAR